MRRSCPARKVTLNKMRLFFGVGWPTYTSLSLMVPLLRFPRSLHPKQTGLRVRSGLVALQWSQAVFFSSMNAVIFPLYSSGLDSISSNASDGQLFPKLLLSVDKNAN